MIRRGTNNKITLRHWVVVEILDIRRRVRRQKPGARPGPGLGDRCSADGRPGDRARVQGITEREISAVRTGVWATHAACLHCRHCSDDSMETRGLTPH